MKPISNSTAATAVAEAAPSETEKRQETTERTREKTKRQPPYAVVLHNDDLNTFEFVVGVLRKVFNYDLAKATQLMLNAHRQGRSIVWSGQLEIAELKADQIRSCGPDPEMKASGALALRVTIEPVPQ